LARTGGIGGKSRLAAKERKERRAGFGKMSPSQSGGKRSALAEALVIRGAFGLRSLQHRFPTVSSCGDILLCSLRAFAAINFRR
jgi:hypothetical protein